MPRNALTLPSLIVLPWTLPCWVLTVIASARAAVVVPPASPAIARAHSSFDPTCIKKILRRIPYQDGAGLRRVSGFDPGDSAVGGVHFRGEQIGNGFSAANEAGPSPFDQHLGGARPGVVVGALRHAVGAGIEQSHQIAGFYGGEHAVAGEEVAGFAHRADDVQDARTARAPANRHNLVVRLVERRANQVVHRSVGDDEGLF